MKRVLMLNTSHNDYRMIIALKDMGFYVIATGNTPGLIGESYCDEYVRADYSDKDAMLNLARSRNIDAVCACCNDFGVLTAAFIAEKLNLPGHDNYETAQTLHHKDRFKDFAQRNGIKTPRAHSFDNEKDTVDFIQNVNFPLIVKSADLSAGRGISRADTVDEAIKAVHEAFEASRVKRIVIEPFIEGAQAACCMFIKDKKVIACSTNNEYSFINPYRVEIDTYPALDFDLVKNDIISQTEKIVRILNAHDGIFHIQYRLKDNTPYIIEVMRRTLGNLYSIPAEKLTGINWDYWQARVYCGLDVSDFPVNALEQGFYAYRAVHAQRNGPVTQITVPDGIRRFVFDESSLWTPGRIIQNYLHEPLTILFFQFESRSQMNEIMLERYHEIVVE
jgi:biotin carboxylase